MHTIGQEINYSIIDFYHSKIDTLYDNPIFRKQILSDKRLKHESGLSERKIFNEILNSYLDEARMTLSLISSQNLTKEDSLLEVGGGLGLVYVFLKKQGCDIYGIEPCDSGFDGYFTAAIQLCRIIGVDESHLQPFLAKDVTNLNKQFDVIFSNNVLEHIPELEESISSLRKVLKPSGIMVHNTVNYFIPYEPHFNILLFPFFPRCTEILKPGLKKSSLWNGLNFITTTKLKRICKINNLKIEFRKDALSRAFSRLETDPSFAKRQKYFIPIYTILKLTGLINLLNKIPSALTTPITFTMTRGL